MWHERLGYYILLYLQSVFSVLYYVVHIIAESWRMAKAMRQQRYGKSNLFILPGFLLFLAGPNRSMWNYDYTVINSAVVNQDLRDTPYI